MSNRRVILRADGNKTIGLGHVYRLLALAEIVKNDFECVFVIHNPEPFILSEIKKVCSSHLCLDSELTYEGSTSVPINEMPFDLEGVLNGDEIVVTDGYGFGKNYQANVMKKGSRLVCIDDLAETEFEADIVINHAPGINKSIYKMHSRSVLLTGLDYAILRRPFFEKLENKKSSSKIAFISLGGSDSHHYSARIMEMLLELSIFQEFHILCSTLFDERLVSRLKEFQHSFNKVFLHFNLNAGGVVEVMNQCTHAFISASTVLLESYSRGLQCFAGYYTLNQQFLYQGFVENKFAQGLGDFEHLTREKMAESLKDVSNIRALSTPLCSDKNILEIFKSLSKE